MAFIDDIKNILRLSGSENDIEVSDLISACRSDLIFSGILPTKANSTTDMIIKRAISLYVKSNFGWDNPEAPKFEEFYVLLKKHMLLSEEFTEIPS